MTYGTRWFKETISENIIEKIARDVEKKHYRKRWATFVQRGNPAKRQSSYPSSGLDEIRHLFEPPFSFIKRPKRISDEDLDLYYVDKIEREME